MKTLAHIFGSTLTMVGLCMVCSEGSTFGWQLVSFFGGIAAIYLGYRILAAADPKPRRA